MSEKEEAKRWGINKNLITLKLTLFFLYGATSSLMPYLTVHMQSIGLTIREIASIYLALPLTTFLASPATGFLVDKFGKYKLVIIACFLLNAVLHHALLLIPHQETPGIVPPGFVLTHTKNGYLEVWWSPCTHKECPENEEITVVLNKCIDHCLLAKRKQNRSKFKARQEINQLIQNNIITPENSNISSRTHSNRETYRNKTTDIFHGNTSIMFTLDMHPYLAKPIENIGIELQQSQDYFTSFKSRFSKRFLRRSGVNVTELETRDLRCGGVIIKANFTHKIKKWPVNECILQKCTFKVGGPEICPPDYNDSDDRIFWLYFGLRFLGTIVQTAGIVIMDPVALTMIEKYGGDFGREKLFASIGMALFSPITGAIIDYRTTELGYTDYSAAFYSYDVLLIISAITVFLMPLGTQLPADNVFLDLLTICKIPTIIVFIFFLFLLGNFYGFIEGYLFFYLKELGSPNYLLGVTVTIGTISSLPFLYGANKITKQLGHVNIIIIAFFGHAARLMGYSFIESAWWSFPFEAMESLSVHLLWVAAATYCALLSPKHLLATLIGVIGMAHFSIGRGSGCFIGGHIISVYGIRQAFRFMGLAAVLSGILYAIIYYIWLQKSEEKLSQQMADNLEEDKINLDIDKEPKFRDQGTMVSFERLSLMIEFNQIGSLTSLKRISKDDTIIEARNRGFRRGSYSIGMFKARESASKVDLLKSTIEFGNRNTAVNDCKKIGENRTSSAPTKLNHKSTTLVQILGQELDRTLIPDETEEFFYDSKLHHKHESTSP